MTTPTVRRVRLSTCNGHNFASLNIDPLTRSRLHHAVHVATHVLDTPSNLSVICRAAVALYVAHLNKTAKALEVLPEGEKRTHLLMQEQHRLERATRGGAAPRRTLPKPLAPYTDPVRELMNERSGE